MTGIAVSQSETSKMGYRRWLRTAPDARELLIGFNPRAGPRARRDQIEEIEAELTRASYSVQTTANLAEIGELAARGHQSGQLRAVLACGGDGTAKLLRSHVPLDVPLLPVPMGTESLLSRYLSQSALAVDVRETVDRGVVAQFDLGRANEHYFLMMISAGFDAAVVRSLHEARRGNISRSSYLQPILRTIRSYEYPEMQLYCDADSTPGLEPVRCRWLFGFNLPLYALGWQFTPQASGIDGRLDVCTFQRGSLFDGVRYLWHVVRQSHHRLTDMQLTQGQRLRIETAGGNEIPFQLDGDFAGVLPVKLEVLPGALKLLVMPQVAEKLGFVAADCDLPQS